MTKGLSIKIATVGVATSTLVVATFILLWAFLLSDGFRIISFEKHTLKLMLEILKWAIPLTFVISAVIRVKSKQEIPKIIWLIASFNMFVYGLVFLIVYFSGI